MNPFALRHKLIFVLLMMSLSCPLTGAWAAGRQQLYGHIPKALVTAPRVGSVDPSTPLNLVLSLPLRNNAELQELLKRLYDPLSPEYRHFLTPEQFDAEFGPAEADYRALTAFALSHHLAVVATRPSHRLLEVSGTVGDIQKAFHVGLSHYQRPDGSLFYAPENEPSIDLDVPVLHVGGLDNYQVPKPMLKASAPQEWVGKPKSGFPPKSSFPAATASAGSAPAGLYWGTDFRNAYVPGICLTGNGQTVALIEFEGYYASDIQGYETLAGLPNVPLTNVLIDGYSGTPDKRNDANGIIEASLDIEMAISMAPGLSQVRVYEVKDTAPVAAADMMLDQIATDGKTSPINQISCSWTGFGDTTSETYFEQFATQGQSFFQAAGDDGAYVTGDPETTIPSPINFSSNIEMTVVGGTELTMNGASYQSETTWNAPLAGVTYGGGGGICSQVPIPTYQQDVNMTANGGSTVLRNIPDVSMVAYNIFVVGDGSYTGPTKYSYYTVVGTSAATPLWAGFLALANEQGAAGGVTVGFANPALYAIGMGGNYSSDFNDIRDSSTNNLSGNANLYKAIPGYDLATGWGSPTGQNLINGLTGLAASACSSSPTVTRTPTGTPTGAFTKTPINSPSNSPTPHSNRYRHTYSNPNGNQNTQFHCHPDGHEHDYFHGHFYAFTHSQLDWNADTHGDAHQNSRFHGNEYAFRNRHQQPDSHWHGNSLDYPNENANGYRPIDFHGHGIAQSQLDGNGYNHRFRHKYGHSHSNHHPFGHGFNDADSILYGHFDGHAHRHGFADEYLHGYRDINLHEYGITQSQFDGNGHNHRFGHPNRYFHPDENAH